MKSSRLLATIAVIAIALNCNLRADPVLNVDFNQNGDDCSLTWSVQGVTDEHWGVVLYIDINGIAPYPNSVMGWWPSPQPITMTGTIATGWVNAPQNTYIEGAENNMAQATGRTSKIFTLGVHAISARLFEGEGNYPLAFSSDNTQGGIISQTLLSSFTVVDPTDVSVELSSESAPDRVPESGITLPLIALGLGLAAVVTRGQSRNY